MGLMAISADAYSNKSIMNHDRTEINYLHHQEIMDRLRTLMEEFASRGDLSLKAQLTSIRDLLTRDMKGNVKRYQEEYLAQLHGAIARFKSTDNDFQDYTKRKKETIHSEIEQNVMEYLKNKLYTDAD